MSFTPNRRLGFSLTPSPSTRSEKRPSDLRWADGSSNLNRHDREKEVNVQVMVRCRPLSDEEQRINVQKVISCNEQSREVTILQSVANRQVKAFTFDKVFGPKAQQRSIYDHAISPIVNDVLEGFNCTVFAYGQTGTGKTYTMEGVMKSKGGELSADAGVIPRAVRQIFDTLDAQKADYMMKVSFLELYNEEMTDLLAPEDYSRSLEDKQRRPISLMEDGKGGAILRGLEEEFVYGANEIYNLLERGSAKRRTTDTLLNKQSSRSHSIFSITIHIKETTKGDEELLKCGRLNLVDLAGSENVSRSGAREGRAREAGELNKSLLTLGRVITALVEHSGHIPYRDSKLTRLLRESLGGKAKTCIIATVAPSIHCLEETLSTLDYAYRAKSIRNKPELNQKLSKSVLLKDLYLEIDRMKQDVKAAREKNGVYIPHERFAQDEAEKKAMGEKIDHLESEMYLKTKQADKFQELYHDEQERVLDLESEIKESRKNLEDANTALLDLQKNYSITNSMLKEKEFIISSLLNSENTILERAKELRTDLENASEDISTLNTKIDWKTKIERENQGLVLNFGSQLEQSLKNLQLTVVGSVSQQQQLLRCIEEHVCSFIARKCEATKSLELRVEKIRDMYTSGVAAMKKLACALENKASSDLEELKLTVATQTMVVENFLATAVSEADQVLHDVQRTLTEQEQILAFSAQQQEAGLQRSLVSTQVISKTTIDFFNDLQSRVSRLLIVLEEIQTERLHQLGNLKKTFQEASAKEEKDALEKIAGILATLSVTKTDIVSKAIDDVNLTSSSGKTRLELDLIDMQHGSTKTEKEWIAYIERVESQFQEDTFSAAKTRDSMKNILQECLEKVGHSMQHWGKAQLTIDHLNKGCALELESSTDKSIQEINDTLGDFMSVSSSTNGLIDSGTCDLLTGISDSLLLDHEARKDLEPMSTMCMDQLKLLKENYNERIANIRSQAEKCLLKEYLVDNYPSGRTPTEQGIMVPSLASIEALRAPSFDDLVTKMRSNNRLKGGAEGKQLTGMLPETPRSPFTTIN